MWRLSANCIKFNSHPENVGTSGSQHFVMIGRHLREYFNILWQEFMIPSDLPSDADELVVNAFENRKLDREEQLETSGEILLHKDHMALTAQVLQDFIQSGGRVDRMDTDPLWNDKALDDYPDEQAALDRLGDVAKRLLQGSDVDRKKYTLKSLYKDVMACTIQFADRPFDSRIRRLFWKRFASLHEATCRGIDCSYMWLAPSDVGWAREGKTFHPALKLGVCGKGLDALAKRNITRIPEQFTRTLESRCNKLQKKKKPEEIHLVEFLSTHEVHWVLSADSLFAGFYPDKNDPNESGVPDRYAKGFAEGVTKGKLAVKAMASAMNDYVVPNSDKARSGRQGFALYSRPGNSPDNQTRADDDEEDNALIAAEGLFSPLPSGQTGKRALGENSESHESVQAAKEAPAKKARTSISCGESTSSTKLTKLIADIARLSTTQDTLSEDNRKLGQQLVQLGEAGKRDKEKLAQVEQQLSEMVKERADDKEKLAQVEQQLSEMVKERADDKEKLAQVEQQVSKMAKERADDKEEHAQVEQQLSEMVKERDNDSDKLAQVEQRFAVTVEERKRDKEKQTGEHQERLENLASSFDRRFVGLERSIGKMEYSLSEIETVQLKQQQTVSKNYDGLKIRLRRWVKVMAVRRPDLTRWGRRKCPASSKNFTNVSRILA
jgi:hypothetical protein